MVVIRTDDEPFVPPPYPYDRLNQLREMAASLPGGMIDLSIGAPCDAPPAEALRVLGEGEGLRTYPPSIGSPALLDATRGWLDRRFGIAIGEDEVGACLGLKEMVVGLPHWLRLREPDRDTVLYPAVSYPSYAMGARLAGCRSVPVAMDDQWRMDLSSIDDDDADSALCIWVNTPGNPAGALDDLAAVAAWGRERNIPVLSDECYIEFTWDGEPRSILRSGVEGVLALHSLSKRSNLAGLRVGSYSGDPDLVHYLREIRKHTGAMIPGPNQAAAVAALNDDAHVDAQKEIYRERINLVGSALRVLGANVDSPGGGFYLWVEANDGDAWDFADFLARRGGAVVSPGEFYGDQGHDHVRIALVQPTDRLKEMAVRLGA